MPTVISRKSSGGSPARTSRSPSQKSVPIQDAAVKAFGKEMGKTDAKGEFVYEYKELPKAGADLIVSKSGFSTWHKTGALEPGQRLQAPLSKQALIPLTALTEEYGEARGPP